MYPVNVDKRGSFQELAHASDVKFGQLSILQVNPGCARGGHYHTRKEEEFCCIHGKCEMKMTNVKDGTTRVVLLDGSKQEFILIKPYESHIVRNFSKSEVCELLIIASEEYNPEDTDTFKLKV